MIYSYNRTLCIVVHDIETISEQGGNCILSHGIIGMFLFYRLQNKVLRRKCTLFNVYLKLIINILYKVHVNVYCSAMKAALKTSYTSRKQISMSHKNLFSTYIRSVITLFR